MQKFYDLSEKDHWRTPEYIVSMFMDYMMIDLDPCAGYQTYIAENNYTIEGDGDILSHGRRLLFTNTDGLEKDWSEIGGTAYVNPPFSLKKEFVQKTVEEYESNHIDRAIVLTPNGTEVRSWWHGNIAQWDGLKAHHDYVWFPSGRIKFVEPGGDAQDFVPFGSCFHFLGDEWPDGLFEELDEKGEMMIPWQH